MAKDSDNGQIGRKLTSLESAAAYKIPAHPLKVATWNKLKYPAKTLSKFCPLFTQFKLLSKQTVLLGMISASILLPSESSHYIKPIDNETKNQRKITQNN